MEKEPWKIYSFSIVEMTKQKVTVGNLLEALTSSIKKHRRSNFVIKDITIEQNDFLKGDKLLVIKITKPMSKTIEEINSDLQEEAVEPEYEPETTAENQAIERANQ